MTREDLNWRKHPLDEHGFLASFTTTNLFVSIATTRWTYGYSLYWRMKHQPPQLGRRGYAESNNVLDAWLERLGAAPADMVTL